MQNYKLESQAKKIKELTWRSPFRRRRPESVIDDDETSVIKSKFGRKPAK